MSANNVNSRFLLSLYSSDAGGLTFEGEFATYEEAFERVENWVPEGNDIEVERQSGMWLIEEEVGPRMQYRTQVMALYRKADFQCTQESEKAHPSYKPVLFETFRTRCHAETYIAKAKRIAEEDNKRDLIRYKRDLEFAASMKEAGKEFKEPKLVLEIDHWSEKIKTMIHSDTGLDELKELQFPEPGFVGMSEPREFKLMSGDVRVTDPCYEMNTWCAGTVTDVARGVWRAQVGNCIDEFDIKHSKERFHKEIADIESTEDVEAQKLEELAAEIEKQPEGEEKERAKKAITRIANNFRDYRLRELLEYGNPMTWKGRISFLHIRHESVPADEPIDPTKFVKSEIHVGVDSGQAGFFNAANYEREAHKMVEGDRHSAFYSACMAETLKDDEAWGTVMGWGVVSSTGWGDGGYNLFIRRNEEGQMIEGRIVYLNPGNEGFISVDEDEEGDEE